MPDDQVIVGSGNIFADLNVPDTEQHLVKARLAVELRHRVDLLGEGLATAATRVGATADELKSVFRGHFEHHDAETLQSRVDAVGDSR